MSAGPLLGFLLIPQSLKCRDRVNRAGVQLHTVLQVFPTLLQKCHALPVPAALSCFLLVYGLLDDNGPIKSPIKVKSRFTPERAAVGKDCTFQLSVAQ